MSLITIIGRGHSGTRAMSHTLLASGVFMGEPLNRSGDLLPPEAMYEACRVLARYVRWLGDLRWDWSALFNMPIPDEFAQLIRTYLRTVLEDQSEHRGWKIPETTLVLPWIVRLFPEAKYIYWVRNPRDCILGRHLTDDLHDFGIDYPATDDVRLRRAISWRYQYDLIRATPRPAQWIEVRLEDFVLRQEETLTRLEAFLGIKLARIVVNPEVVGRYRLDGGPNYYDILEPAMREYGYEVPGKLSAASGQLSTVGGQ
ncbi:MAG: sulfotransferase family protein [Anaerolineae bacterium]